MTIEEQWAFLHDLSPDQFGSVEEIEAHLNQVAETIPGITGLSETKQALVELFYQGR